jgi:hypothetical protein
MLNINRLGWVIVLLFPFLLVLLFVLCAVVVTRLPVLGRQLRKLRLPHYLRGLFDARDWYGPENMVGYGMLLFLYLFASYFGECLAVVKDFNVD